MNKVFAKNIEQNFWFYVLHTKGFSRNIIDMYRPLGNKISYLTIYSPFELQNMVVDPDYKAIMGDLNPKQTEHLFQLFYPVIGVILVYNPGTQRFDKIVYCKTVKEIVSFWQLATTKF